MKTLQFKCTLLSDIILNQKAASDGVNKTLDFIPGSNFLGIVANELYKTLQPEVALEIFHSGHVRFGDAHPSFDGFRGLKVPAAIMEPKLKTDDNNNYIHFHTDMDNENIKKLQLKQCRSGFYDFSSTEAQQIKAKTSFAVKSAYDRDKRRSEDEKMFGYESLRKGLTLLFEVQVDDDKLADKIKGALVGEKRLGRSRTAQYGLVKIEECKYNEIESQQSSNNFFVVYADSRLIFLDEFGLPTFQPEPKDLLGTEIEGAEICWEFSQVRTFQYAPYNYKRQCFDTDRCGIEKGSVFVITGVPQDSLLQSQYVGSYQNEGFGKVIYNPAFLQAESDGKAVYKLPKDEKDNEPKAQEIETNGNTLLNYLIGRRMAEIESNNVYKNVNDWVDKNGYLFVGKEKFASQWGTIRAFAMANKQHKPLDEQIEEYISHGVKAEDWLGNRRSKLREFMNAHKGKNNFREMMVNLAAQMAKKCKKEDKQ